MAFILMVLMVLVTCLFDDSVEKPDRQPET